MRNALKTGLGRLITLLWGFLKQKRKYALIAIFLIAIGYIFGVSLESIEAMLIIGILFVLASVSTMYKRLFRAPPALELMTFTTVIVTMKYGLVAGLIFGALSQLVSEILSEAIDAQIVIFIPARALISVWIWASMSLFGVNDLFTLGMIAIVFYNLTVQPISFFIGDVQLKAKTIYYTIGYTTLNIFIFAFLSRPVSALLGLG
ncbi:hypothetical protein HYY72_00760 [Candidatus Woesearchaeota archaeon]|nr:hypothetical protein [Candidatus Woesearchaeota archaeon]